ncbi:hypothetical protein TUM18999_14290 [Pseudomonas tohonis]|uniref:Protein-glutamine gamma-glutamyltransferase-like C-terminal domain-containing protein n=1 Tax=Pseudomonas tohonis TaxID=2725477 RepID=A0A6J4E1B5_9PSED|nr:DUF4129 domain-containing protein [Pseudomonas tohonis]BCG23238.1 hypothetical protein TUM18999_14290 [Pseudomonas tohonis]GJN55277.1 hypothetical protein TUM20286_50290 [Pseudomonas tohonis]
MRLTDASVAIRPRSAWEAMDLGVLLARRHMGLLMASWALITLPVFLLLSLLLWNYSGWAMFVFWLLKPAFERLPLYILSRALFGDTPTLKEALKAYPRLLKPQLIASLTWRRFSPSRSFDMPVMQLEGLSGAARSQRLVVLGQRDAGGATWLTIIGMHLETALWMGLITLLYLMLPQQVVADWDWQKLLEQAEGDWVWMEHLSNSLYFFVLMVWEPVYVACGFTLYLNRRTALEAWDIELVFRRLRQRLTGLAYALVLGMGVVLATTLPAQPVLAAEGASSCPLPVEDPNGPDAPRLTHQELSSQAASESIAKLLDEPPFENRETVTRWRFPDTDAKDKKKEELSKEDAESLTNFIKGLFKLADLWNSTSWLALIIKVVLWGLLISLVALVIWRYREWLSTFVGSIGLPQRKRREAPLQLFGLEVAPETLPDDVASEAERLWAEHPREALGLLYRALLSHLLHDFRLPLKGSHTEGEVLGLVQGLQRDELSRFAQVLTRHWQNLAYGHQLPPESLKRGLCEGWRRLIAKGASA